MDGSEYKSGTSTKGCILVLCGLPASGKTALSNELCIHFNQTNASCERKCTLVHTCYDKILTPDVEQRLIELDKSSMADVVTDSTGISKTSSGWKNSRLSILNCVDSLVDVLLNQKPGVEKPDQVEDDIWENFRSEVAMEMLSQVVMETDLKHVVVVIDDNMYYSSMRYQYYQLARKYHLGFCQVHISCDVEESVRRNAQRMESVQTHVITDMAERFEAPDPQRNHWERNSATLPSSITPDLNVVISLIDTALDNPVEIIEEDRAEKEESRVSCSQSALYQLDQILRKLVAQNIEDARGKLSKEEMRNLGRKLNCVKTILYSDLKTGSLRLPGKLLQNVTDASKSKTKMTPIGNNVRFSTWMADLPGCITEVPLNSLALPGSHNSFSFDLDKRGGVSIDEPAAVKTLGNCCCGAGCAVVKRWGTTQTLSFSQQLESGVRYFDLRVAIKPDTTDFYFLHGLYGPKVVDGMRDIRKFMTSHNKEVILLDFNHFYNMDEVSHSQLLSMLKSIFQETLVLPYDKWEPGTATLQNLWQTPGRVYIFYHNEAIKGTMGFWPGFKIPAPWPNTNKIAELIRFQDNIYDNHRRLCDGFFYGWDCMLTPKTSDIVRHLFCGSLESSMALEASRQMVQWLKGKVAGPTAINICLGDFVEANDFIPTVIDINYKTYSAERGNDWS